MSISPLATPSSDCSPVKPRVTIVGGDALRNECLGLVLASSGLNVQTAAEFPDSLDADVIVTDQASLGAAAGRTDLAANGRRVYVLHDEAEPAPLPGHDGNGISGFISFRYGAEELLDIMHGRTAAPSSVGVSRVTPTTSAIDALTGRELDVLTELIAGGSNDTIGRRLGISGNTVRTHVQNLLPKLGVSSRLEAASMALRSGLGLPRLEDVS